MGLILGATDPDRGKVRQSLMPIPRPTSPARSRGNRPAPLKWTTPPRGALVQSFSCNLCYQWDRVKGILWMPWQLTMMMVAITVVASAVLLSH